MLSYSSSLSAEAAFTGHQCRRFPGHSNVTSAVGNVLWVVSHRVTHAVTAGEDLLSLRGSIVSHNVPRRRLAFAVPPVSLPELICLEVESTPCGPRLLWPALYSLSQGSCPVGHPGRGLNVSIDLWWVWCDTLSTRASR